MGNMWNIISLKIVFQKKQRREFLSFWLMQRQAKEGGPIGCIITVKMVF